MSQTMTTTKSRGIGRGSKHSISGLFIFLLIASYAVFSLLLVLIGVQVYRNVVQTAEQNGEMRTTIGYISGRLRAADGQISVREDEGGFKVMRISNALGEEDYETRIYFAPNEEGEGGALYEQVVDVTEPFDWEMGELIVEIGDFQMEQTGDVLNLTLLTKKGETSSMHLKLLPNQLAPKDGERS